MPALQSEQLNAGIEEIAEKETIMYHYTAYGLNIASEFTIPELLSAPTTQPDVTIYYGESPEVLTKPTADYVTWQASAGKFLLKIHEVASYFILEGREIRVTPSPGCTAEDIRVFLLGSVLAVILQQRHILPLHASAIQTEQGAVLFLGRSGSGKSTLLAALLQRGYAMLADDVAGITQDANGHLFTLPAFPYARVWKDVVNKLHYNELVQRRVRGDLEKYLLPVEHFCNDSIPLYAAFVLTNHNQSNISLEALNAIQRFEGVTTYSYRKKFWSGLNLEPVHFQLTSAMAAQITMFRVTRPIYPFLLDELIEKIELSIKNPLQSTNIAY